MIEKIKKEVFEWFKVIITAVALAFIITQFIRPTLVRGESMIPTLEENDYLIINRMSYRLGEPEKGDIIVFETELLQANGEHKDLVKRVIAVEGDHIKIDDANVYVNGELLEESYIYEDYTEGSIDMIIPEGKVFVMGDNRQNSLDSRYSAVDLVDEKDIMGKVMIRLYPFNKIGSVN